MELFSRTWTDLRTVVADLGGDDFQQPSGCAGWRVQDLACHLIIDAQDVLITLATPSDTAPTHDAASYWSISGTAPTGNDPLDALIVRLAAAYQDPGLLQFHLDDVGSAAGRAATLADPHQSVSTQDKVLTVTDYLHAYVLEWTLHHLDMIASLPGRPGPATAGLAFSRELLERIAGFAFPESMSHTDVLLMATGRRGPTEAEDKALGSLSAPLPLYIG